MKRIVGLCALAGLMLVSCGMQPEGNGENLQAGQAQAGENEAMADDIVESAVTPDDDAPVEETEEDMMRDLSPSTEPVAVTFTAADGFELQGVYYPAVYMDVPVVVLMHQANMDRHEWDAIAPWLQNARGGQASDSSIHGAKLVQSNPWQDDSWFPALPEDFSVSVFTFTFRGCENGCSSFDRDGWVLDAAAALEKAASMPEVDASRVVPVGTSIGADGAVDGCYALGAESSIHCLDSFSLSPGSYLTIEYAEAVTNAIEQGRDMHCFATQGDPLSAQTCRSVDMVGFRAYVEEGSEHGIEMINADHEVNILEILRDYLVDEVLS